MGTTSPLKALALVQSPLSTNADRREAQIFLDTVKTQNQNLLELALNLLQKSLNNTSIESLHVQHFAFQLLQHAINANGGS